MPQRYIPRGQLVWGDAALDQERDLAVRIASVAGRWTVVEEMWGVVFAHMLGAAANTGVAIYFELAGAASQAAALRAAGKERLTPSLLAILEEQVRVHRALGLQRNAIVHGRWAADTGRLGCLLLSERNWLPRRVASATQQAYETMQWKVGPEISKEHLFTPFDIQRFRSLEVRIDKLIRDQSDFGTEALNHVMFGKSYEAETFEQSE